MLEARLKENSSRKKGATTQKTKTKKNNYSTHSRPDLRNESSRKNPKGQLLKS